MLSSDYKTIFLEDFNVTSDEDYIQSFCENYGLKNLIRQPTCYKNLSNPSCTDLILTNVPRSFQSTSVVETGLSGIHLMTLTVMRKSLKKHQPKTISYRSYKGFSNEKYRDTLINNLSKENFINNDDGFQRFCHISLDALNKHVHVRRSMLKVIKCPSSIKNYRKQLWLELNYETFFYKIGVSKIEYVIQNKEILSLF